MIINTEDMQKHFQSHSRTKELSGNHTAKVHSVGWSCDGRLLASGSFDKTVSVFLMERDRLVRITRCKSRSQFDQFKKLMLTIVDHWVVLHVTQDVFYA